MINSVTATASTTRKRERQLIDGEEVELISGINHEKVGQTDSSRWSYQRRQDEEDAFVITSSLLSTSSKTNRVLTSSLSSSLSTSNSSSSLGVLVAFTLTTSASGPLTVASVLATMQSSLVDQALSNALVAAGN